MRRTATLTKTNPLPSPVPCRATIPSSRPTPSMAATTTIANLLPKVHPPRLKVPMLVGIQALPLTTLRAVTLDTTNPAKPFGILLSPLPIGQLTFSFFGERTVSGVKTLRLANTTPLHTTMAVAELVEQLTRLRSRPLVARSSSVVSKTTPLHVPSIAWQ